MIPQSQANIYLSGERACTEQDWFRSYSTFTPPLSGNGAGTHFGPLYEVTDNTLAPGRSVEWLAAEASLVILLPTVGAIAFTGSTGGTRVIEAGQVMAYAAAKGDTIETGNPYESDLVNFLQFWIRIPDAPPGSPHVFSFNLDHARNMLVKLIPDGAGTGQPVPLSGMVIGKFTGRQEAGYTMARPGNGLFVFVIEGAFEVQYRLLESRDGLAIWDTAAVELEALSNDAIILMIELPLTSGE